eukprot:TRINITY_DN34_c2_g2_i1.p1 TRINITY_DN34_c2_g2~~TRINITY_DN34_c2_g2_i1.p1  ORF type:complete len:141 (-),score=7.87 TRINITY_DN34_c2_g2_i1:282-704(-)
MCKAEVSQQRAVRTAHRASPFWNLVNDLFGAQARGYYAAKAQVRSEDTLIVAEILVCFVVIETWMRVVLPGLGLQSGEPCPWASYVRRQDMFLGTPLGYCVCMFWSVVLWTTCGTASGQMRQGSAVFKAKQCPAMIRRRR